MSQTACVLFTPCKLFALDLSIVLSLASGMGLVESERQCKQLPSPSTSWMRLGVGEGGGSPLTICFALLLFFPLLKLRPQLLHPPLVRVLQDVDDILGKG